jgi:membrane protease YdiL (CAAX protease family)
MKHKCLLRQILLLSILILISGKSYAQKILDHSIFINQLNNSSEILYKECIQKYDSYLEKHPTDVSVLIEKCKFVQLAQYNEDEEYNPNQEEFDSCLTYLTRLYPMHPDVLLFQTSLSWADELKEVFKKSEESIKNSPESWSKTNLGELYSKMADQFYNDEKMKPALEYIEKAISNDNKYENSIIYAKILIKLGKTDQALKAILNNPDTTKEIWSLKEKADLLLELKAYQEALKVFNMIDKIDSTYNNNFEISSTLSSVGEYKLARKYLVADTLKNWNKRNALKNLFIHDLKYEDASTCLNTYNEYRGIGFSCDPFGIYRIRLLLSHPLLPWKLRDIFGPILLLIVLFILFLIPSIWILPIYFVGHHWGLLNSKKTFETLWGLKVFWIVSAGYLIASFLGYLADPDSLYSLFNKSYLNIDLTQESNAKVSLIFISVFGLVGLFSLGRRNLKVLLSKNWSIIKSILIGFGILLAFKIITVVYLKLGISFLGISKKDLFAVTNLILSSKQDIEAIITTYNNGFSLFLLCLFVPLYEEIIFRGVILDSTMRYINFGTANFIQASLFSIIHMNLFLMPLYFLFGLITGFMRRYSGGLLSGIAFHSINNFLAVIMLILT